MVITPMITVRIEMTIATIGRLMKNLDITCLPLLRLRAIALALRRMDDRSGPYLEQAVCDDALARFQSALDNPIRADAIAHRNAREPDGVVRIDDRYGVRALRVDDRPLRNQ